MAHVKKPDDIFQRIFGNSLNATFSVNQEELVLHANIAACKLFGYTYNELTSLKLSDLFYEMPAGLRQSLHSKSISAGPMEELTAIKKCGQQLSLYYSVITLINSADEYEIAIILNDSDFKNEQQNVKVMSERNTLSEKPFIVGEIKVNDHLLKFPKPFNKSLITEAPPINKKLLTVDTATEDLQRSEQNFQDLINTIDGIVWQADAETYQFYFVSKFAETLLGYPVQQWMDEPNFWKDHVHPDDKDSAIEYCLRCTDEKISHELDYRMIAANGREVWLHDRVAVIVENDKALYLWGIMTDITYRKEQQILLEKSNEDLKKSEQHLKNVSAELEKIMTYSLDVICAIDKEGKFVRVSAACLDVWGYTPTELIGTHYIDHVDPDYLEITKLSLAGIMSGVGTKNFENRYVHKNGNSVPLTWSARWDETEQIIFCVARDTSALIEAERLEAESEQRWKTIFNRANDGILLINNSAKLTQVNSSAANILGYAKDELLNLTVFDLAVPSTAPELEENLWDKFLKEGYQNGIVELIRKDGRIIICHYNAVVNIIPGLHLSIFTDITEREKTRRKIDQLNIILEKRAEELAASNKELESFAYVTSHDLQEPLRMVTSFLQLLQTKYNDQLDEIAQKYISYAVDGAERMKDLILDLLEYSRISSYRDDHISVDLNEVLARTLHSLKALINEAEASIHSSNLPQVIGNRSQLVQLFQNLISNAIKYRSALQPNIEIGYLEKANHWEFFVKDNGIGIDPKFFERIFIIFQRLHNRRDYDGTGIGLSICKRIVELHQGKIWVESSIGAGSTFYFTIAKTHTPNASAQDTLFSHSG